MALGMRGRRSMLERHLRRVHGNDISAADLQREVRRSFASYARYWMESFRLPTLTPALLDAGMAEDGMHYLTEAVRTGTGAILAIPHLGGWDFGGAWLATKGIRATVVVEPLEPPELFEWFAAFRQSLGMTVVPLGPAAGTAVLGALKRGEIVCLISDRDIGGNGVEVEFFGERTTLPSGPAMLALRTGAPLLSAAVYFTEGRGHAGVVRPPIDAQRTGTFRQDVARITQTMAHELEYLIRRAPDQWHLFQPNWPSDRAG